MFSVIDEVEESKEVLISDNPPVIEIDQFAQTDHIDYDDRVEENQVVSIPFHSVQRN